MIDLKKIEKEAAEFWRKNKIYEKLLARKGKKFFLLDGPPYANALPHIGHVKNTVFKDLIIRMEFMKGSNVLFQPGFDTHGLPIENLIEKKLGLKDKKDIEKMGIAKFMKECRDNATLYKDIWMKTYEKLGSVYSLKEPYLTYDNSYIESGWWAFAQMYKKKLVYDGEKPVMWCPRCETSLAGYEVTDSYKDVTDIGIYVLFKLKDKNEYLLVYTTTPWTLPANVALAVAPKENYVEVEVSGKKIILAEKRLEKLSEMGFGYSVLETFKGEKLVGKKYEPLLNVPLQKELDKEKLGKAHIIVASIPILKERVASKIRIKKAVSGGDVFEEFVTMNEGSGVVHTAPGHGKTDFIVGQHYKLAVASPVDDKGNMMIESGFSGFVKDADKEIINKLEEEGKLIFKEPITHSYPLCWRCKTPLIFRLSKQLFLRIEKVKKIMEKENKKVNWMPEFARDRFENWVENAEDWNISRQRYWGIPIPIWRCSSCKEEKVIESRGEIEKLSGKKIDDLHVVEEVKIKCKCGKELEKYKGILDVWFDSGIAPWASMGYPFKNKKLFEEHFPVDRINEAQDQIRGWFYSLMFCSAAVFEKAPYKGVSMTGWVVDKNGVKMSKSLGNVVDAQEAIDKLGADVLRYYFCWDVAPYELQKFNEEIAKKEIGNIFNILWNLKNLASEGKVSEKEPEDRWIISRLNSTIKKYEEDLEKFELHSALRSISDFIVNDLSRKYIQMTREKENGAVVNLCLQNILKLLAPVSPFITEAIWQSLKEKKIAKEESVHLCEWPPADRKKIDEKLEREFENAVKVIEIGLMERDKAKIGLRWPLARAKIFSDAEISKELEEIISRQLNVKKLEFKKAKETKVELDTKITPELEAEGFAREIARNIQAERKRAGLQKGELIKTEIYSDEETKKMLKSHLNFLKERTNSKEINFIDGKAPKDAFGADVKEKKIKIKFMKK